MAGNGFADVDALRGWPKSKDLIIGALVGKNLRVEKPAAIADNLRRVLEHVPGGPRVGLRAGLAAPDRGGEEDGGPHRGRADRA